MNKELPFFSKHLKSVFLSGLLFLCMNTNSFGQKYYALKLDKDLLVIGTGALLLGLGLETNHQIEPLSTTDIDLLDPSSISGFDKSAIYNSSEKAHNYSDFLFWGSVGTGVIFSLHPRHSNENLTSIVIFGETLLFTGGLTILTKSIAKRKRPFVYNPLYPLEDKLGKNTQDSFFSGHTSIVAASTFSAAAMFSHYYPKSPWKPVIWGLAIGLPALTAYLRVEAGKHFPSDVITGYIIGGACGLLIPLFHKINLDKNNMNIQVIPSTNSMAFVVNF